MAPIALDTVSDEQLHNIARLKLAGITSKTERASKLIHEPLQLSGALDKFEPFEVTPVIGTEFSNVNLVDWLNAPNSDELIRDLAITISQRGVVFFRAQDDLDNDLQGKLIQRLGELSGKPKESGLHIHPISNTNFQHNADDKISVISNDLATKIFCDRKVPLERRQQSIKVGWHSDITFEPFPADYAALRLTSLPTNGGDTLWASGYELYDRFSPLYQKFLDGLHAECAQPAFVEKAREGKVVLYTGPRGNPANTGDELRSIHPVVRTNPVTGWKTLFGVGHHVQRIEGLTDHESSQLLTEFLRMITENHDLQCRFRWGNKNDIAIWDNRSTVHCATYDYDGQGLRTGQRSVGIGERPYLDPESVGRKQALGEEVIEAGPGFTVF